MIRYKLFSLLIVAILAASSCGKDDNNAVTPDTGSDAAVQDQGVTDLGVDMGSPQDMGADVSSGDTGSDAGEQTDAGPTSLTVDEYVEAIIAARCDSMFQCPNRKTLEGLVLFGAFTSSEECQASQWIQDYMRFLALPIFGDQSLDDGHVTFDGEAAADCAAKTPAFLCDEVSIERPPSCAEVFTGQLQEGETCRLDECAEGLRCDRDTECYGTCVPRTTPCGECEEDEYCDYGASTCRTKVGDGEACPSDAACEDGLICDGDPGTCRVPGSQAKDEACIETFACDAGLACRDYVCAPYFVVGEDFACGDLPTYQICEPGLTCFDPDDLPVGTCVPLHGEGETCYSPLHCEPELYCDTTTETCTQRKPFGATCADHQECESRRCDSTTLKCVALEIPTCDLP